MKRIGVVWLCIMLMFSSAVVLVDLSEDVGGKVVVADSVTYVTYTPIRIDSNTDFANQALAEGWNGSGMENDPYIIEGYEIDGDGNGYCIFVGNTSLHFIIRNCALYNAWENYNPPYYTESVILFHNVENGTIVNNTFSPPYIKPYPHNRYGIYLNGSSSNTISNNTASMAYYGIYLYSSPNNTISNNTASSNKWGKGIYLLYSDGNIISNNNASYNPSGIYLYQSSTNIIANNTGWYNSYSIYLESSSSNTISNNIVSSNRKNGIHLYFSNNNIISNNNASSNDYSGIYLGSSFSNDITDNTMTEDGIFIDGFLLEHWNTHNIDTSNTVNGKPVYYWKNQSGGTIPLGAGQVILANCTNVIIENQNVSNGSVGIELGFSYNNTISNNTASRNRYGMYLYSSGANNISNNTLSHNDYRGIFLSAPIPINIDGGSTSMGTTIMGDYNPRTILLKLKADYRERITSMIAINEIESEIGARMEKNFLHNGILKFELLKDTTVPRAIEKLSTDPRILYIEPDYRISIDNIPNDPGFGSLWGLHNTGQTGGATDADIDAPEVWDIATGTQDVVVAVIDTGVDYNHIDLAGNMWTNPNEVPGNSIDDDNNGYIDDVYGINAITGSGDPMDDHYHGTHCAGTIGAVGNNSIGVVGVNWNVSIMALKFITSEGWGYTSDALECLEYTIKMKENGTNIKVTSNSWGGDEYSQALYDAIAACRDRDILFVAAAGNSGANADYFPAYPASYNLTNIISAAATDHNDGRAFFSNYGTSSVDVAAPGVNINSTLPNNLYGSRSGTSMAAPHVSGLAALISSTNLSYNYINIKNLIMTTVDQNPSLFNKVVTNGRINAYNALSFVPDGMRLLIHSPGNNSQVLKGEPIEVVASVNNGIQPITNASVIVSFSTGDPPLTLYDDGVGSDEVAGDGYYFGSWTPAKYGLILLNVTASATGYNTVSEEVTVFGTRGNIIASNYCVNNSGTGIWLYRSSGHTISNNNLSSNNRYGVYLYSSPRNTITNNTVSSNNEHGIYIYSSPRNTITNNTVSSNNEHGIYIYYSPRNTITNNTVSSNHRYGIYLRYSDRNTIANNTVNLNNDYGVYLYNSGGNIVANNTALNNRYGIYLYSSSSNNIANNTALNNSDGIRLYSSSCNTIAYNTASSNYGAGIYLTGSDNNTIANNTASSNNWYGIYLQSSSSNTLTKNTMVNDGILIRGTFIEHWNTHTIDTSNTVNGKPVHYWKNQTGATVPIGAGQVILANCTNVIIEGQNVNNGSAGIELGFSNNNTIANNTASSNNRYGIYLYLSDSNNIANNTVSSNNEFGIYLYFSSSNNIANNTASSNNRYGIYIGTSSSNTIANNTVSSNNYSIYIGWSDSNTIANNTISSNNYSIYIGWSDSNTIANNTVSSNNYGIYIYFSSSNNIANNIASDNNNGIWLISFSNSNTIYHNNIISNTNQAYDDGNNFWNLSYPESGNYWSDHNSTDSFSGPNQDQLGSDGIGDTPYINISGGAGAQDNYPLMEPWEESAAVDTTDPPNIEITNLVGGEDWTGGSNHQIEFTALDTEDDPANLTVFLNYTSGAGNGEITQLQGNRTPYTWTLPTINATDVIVNATVIDSDGNKSYDDSPEFTIDSSPPEVVSTNPANNTTGISIFQPVVIQFNEPMNISSVIVNQTNGTNPGGWSWFWNEERDNITGIHNSWKRGETIEITVHAGYKDDSDPGNANNTAYVFSFTTEINPSPEIIHPNITSSKELGDEIRINATITDDGTVINAVIWWQDVDDVWHESYMDKNGNDWEYLIPGQMAEGKIRYQINATDDLQQKNTTIIYEFDIEDSTPPEITHTPVESALIDESINITCQVTDLGGVNASAVYFVYRYEGDSEFMVEPMNPGFWYEIPAHSVLATIEYYIQASDIYGNDASTQLYSLEIIDTSVTDTTPPEVLLATPSGDNIPILTDIFIVFSEAVNQTSVESAILISPAITNISYIWLNNETLLIEISGNLSYNTTYTVTTDTGAKDLAGNTLTNDYIWQFTTVEDPEIIQPLASNDWLWIVLIIILVGVILLLLYLFQKERRKQGNNNDP